MDIKIITEVLADYPNVFSIIEQAFLTEELSAHREQFLLERLRFEFVEL